MMVSSSFCHWRFVLPSKEKNCINVILSNTDLKTTYYSAEGWWTSASLWHPPSCSVLRFVSVWLQKLRRSQHVCTAYFTCASLDLSNLFTCRLFTEKCTCGLTLYLNRNWIYYLTLSDLKIVGKRHRMNVMLFFCLWLKGQVICRLFSFVETSFPFHWVRVVPLIRAPVLPVCRRSQVLVFSPEQTSSVVSPPLGCSLMLSVASIHSKCSATWRTTPLSHLRGLSFGKSLFPSVSTLWMYDPSHRVSTSRTISWSCNCTQIS